MVKAASHLALLVALTAVAGCAYSDGSQLQVAAAQAESQPSSEWRAVNRDAGSVPDLARWEQIAADFPDSAAVQLRLFNAYIQAEDTGRALAVATV